MCIPEPLLVLKSTCGVGWRNWLGGALRGQRNHFGDERGFTLPELLTVIAILGILIAIAILTWLSLLEQRRVDAATNQLMSDLRLAHTSATNQLTDWRVVLYPERADAAEGPDYYLVKLTAPYPEGGSATVDQKTPRTFPANVKVVNISGALDSGDDWAVDPSVIGQTRTLEFNSRGSMRFYQAVSGSTCITVDGNPQNRVTVIAATSQVKINEDPCW
jgi:prepilin-type N-terminal cleavage/methylation domain-containing protein